MILSPTATAIAAAIAELEASADDSAEARTWLDALYAAGQLEDGRRTLTTP